MLKNAIFILLLLTGLQLYAQIGGIGRDLGDIRRRGNNGKIPGEVKVDTSAMNKKAKKLKVYPLKMYAYVRETSLKDTLRVDTVLDLEDYYRANFAQKDLFEYMPFQNIGQPVNRLDSYFFGLSFFPDFVPQGKMAFARTDDEIHYYKVPTPYSRLFFLTGNNQGQMLDSRIGINILPRWTLALGYRGLSSLGYYRRSLSSMETWFFNTAYEGWEGRYKIRFYMYKNHLENEESGGITDENLFENQSDVYADRGRLPVRLENDKSIFHQRKTGIFQSWKRKKNDKISFSYDFVYDKGYFEYEGGTQDVYGPAITYSLNKDSIAHRDYKHTWSLDFKNEILETRLGWKHQRMFIRFDTTVVVNNQSIPESNLYVFNYLESESYYDFGQVKNKTLLRYEMMRGLYKILQKTSFEAGKWEIRLKLLLQKRLPRPVFWIWQSRFERYNWKQEPLPVKESLMEAEMQHEKWGKIRLRSHIQYTRAYLDDTGIARQYPGKTEAMKVYYGKNFKAGRFGFYPEVQWQQVLAGRQVLDMPQWIGRASLYYNDWWFHKHMWMQSGITLKYFSEYYMPGYFPLLNTFYEQRQKKYGGFYLLDFFFNFKVKKFRAFLKWAHINAYWEKRKPRYYSAPGYPFADHYIRLGIIWEFTN